VEFFQGKKVVAIFRNVPLAALLPRVELLLENGLNVMEITLNSPDALESIYQLKNRYINDILLGAGSVLKAEEVRLVKEAGGEFIISPNVNIEVIKETKKCQMISLPGALTPTEAIFAHENGADIIKIFPAYTMGPNYAKDLKAPYSDLILMGTGGINEHNAKEFLEKGYNYLGIGSALTDISGDIAVLNEKIKRIASL
jgi:2-dehydro-3-deoxyphosphogluconate aldolase / (4S)-4-hydroxy-2-oxoglutarate aldolase